MWFLDGTRINAPDSLMSHKIGFCTFFMFDFSLYICVHVSVIVMCLLITWFRCVRRVEMTNNIISINVIATKLQIDYLFLISIFKNTEFISSIYSHGSFLFWECIFLFILTTNDTSSWYIFIWKKKFFIFSNLH